MKKTKQNICAELEEFEELKTSRELAEILNLSTRRIRQLCAEGIVFRHESGKYQLIRSVRGYCKFMHENDQKMKSSQTFQDARAAKEVELVRALKRKREIDEGKYVSREIHGQAIAAAMNVQSREFTILLNKLQRLIPGMSDSQFKAIEHAIVKAHNAVCSLKLDKEENEPDDM